MQVKKKPKKTAKAVPEKSKKKKQPSEDQIKKQPFLKRMLFGEEKPDLSELEAGSPPFSTFSLPPRWIQKAVTTSS